jgi:hypothetical protein
LNLLNERVIQDLVLGLLGLSLSLRHCEIGIARRLAESIW